jgi:hypothetical protein
VNHQLPDASIIFHKPNTNHFIRGGGFYEGC